MLRHGLISNSTPISRLVPAILGLLIHASLLTACGGGGGGSGPTVIPTVPTSTGTPTTAQPTPTPTPIAAARLSKVLEVGDRVGRLDVRAIEDAAMAEDGSVAMILGTENGNTRTNGVYLRSADGDRIDTLLDASKVPAGFDLDNLGRLRIAPDGGFAFQTGDGLDSDQLLLAHGQTVTSLAGTAPGVIAPTFRILGDVRIGRGPLLAFAGGGGECTVETVNEEVRTRCTSHLFLADASGTVREVTGFDADLSNESTSGVRVAVNDQGVAWFSVSGRASEDSLIRVQDDQVRSVLKADTEIPGVGNLGRPQIVDATDDERLLVAVTLPPPSEGAPRPGALGVLPPAGGSFTIIARSGDGAEPLSELRGLGLAENGEVAFQARIGEPAEGITLPRTIQRGNGAELVELVREGKPIEPGGLTLLTLRESRFNRRGDLLFVAELGSRDGTTVRVDEIRLIGLPAGASEFVTLASTLTPTDLGTFTAFRIATLDDLGRLLVIGVRSRSSDRILIAGDLAAE